MWLREQSNSSNRVRNWLAYYFRHIQKTEENLERKEIIVIGYGFCEKPALRAGRKGGVVML